MESWRKVWREGILPETSTPGLEACLAGLERNDTRIIQGATTTPPPLQCVQDWPTEAADLIGYSFWIGDAKGEATVAEVEEYFAKVCYEVDCRLGEPAACRWFINWFDDTPRDKMRVQMIQELRINIAQRKAEDRLQVQGEQQAAREQIRYEESQSERSQN